MFVVAGSAALIVAVLALFVLRPMRLRMIARAESQGG